MNFNRLGKTKKEKDIEEAKELAKRMEKRIAELMKKILSPAFLSDADLKTMQDEKAALEKDGRELGKLKRKIVRMQDNLK